MNGYQNARTNWTVHRRLLLFLMIFSCQTSSVAHNGRAHLRVLRGGEDGGRGLRRFLWTENIQAHSEFRQRSDVDEGFIRGCPNLWVEAPCPTIRSTLLPCCLFGSCCVLCVADLVSAVKPNSKLTGEDGVSVVCEAIVHLWRGSLAPRGFWVVANPDASSSAPYPQELHQWSSSSEEPLHSSTKWSKLYERL